jgi:hypothetical protein
LKINKSSANSDWQPFPLKKKLKDHPAILALKITKNGNDKKEGKTERVDMQNVMKQPAERWVFQKSVSIILSVTLLTLTTDMADFNSIENNKKIMFGHGHNYSKMN